MWGSRGMIIKDEGRGTRYEVRGTRYEGRDMRYEI